MNGRVITALLSAILGLFLLVGCIVWIGIDSTPPATSIGCRDNLKTELATAPTTDDNAGTLRIIGVWPKTVSLGDRLCIVVAGVAEAPKAGGAPVPAASITLFLNEENTKLAAKADPKPGPQMLIYGFGEHVDATTEEAKFWRGLLAGKTKDGTIDLSVGVSKSQSSTPTALAPANIEFILYKKKILFLGIAAMVVLLFAFVMFAAGSTILRDNAATANGLPTGTWSLGRTQMALWLVLSVAAFIFLWLTLGFYLHVITNAVLVLLGINGVTGLAAIVMDKAKDEGTATTQNFISDLMCDAEGAKLQRLQMVIWTCVLAIIFVWNAVRNFVFADFDTNLLLLMGIASSTYLGFKTQEAGPKK